MSNTLFARIQLRAYYAAQNDGYAQSPEHYWLAAEHVEHAELSQTAILDRVIAARKAKRSEAAKRGAATRKANAARKAREAMFGTDFIDYAATQRSH